MPRSKHVAAHAVDPHDADAEAEAAFAAAMAKAPPRAPRAKRSTRQRTTEPIPERVVPDPDFVAFSDALDFFQPKTAAALVDETGLKPSAVRRMLGECEERGTVERKGNRYRIAHGIDWK